MLYDFPIVKIQTFKTTYASNILMAFIHLCWMLIPSRQITPNISDCFIIDQLFFLEKQADIDKNSWIWSEALLVSRNVLYQNRIRLEADLCLIFPTNRL